MKNFLSVLSSTLQGGLRGGLLIFALLATSPLWASYSFQSGNLYYYIKNANEVTVTAANNTHSITIPRTVTHDSITYIVTRIGDVAFYACSSLTSISIPNSITSIGEGAFYRCSSLASINIPNGVTSIGYATFYECSSLTSINIPNSVTSIGEWAFSHCSALTSINIPNGVTSIGRNAFSHCSALTSIHIPNGVTSIEHETFWECSSLSSASIGNSVTSIGYNAFWSCSSLTSVNIPNGVTSIKGCAFYRCSALTSITIPNSVTSIEDGAFAHCSALTSIHIPDSVTSIGDDAFLECSSLTSVSIGNSVTNIGYRAFDKCSSLTSIAIPNSVTSIGEWAFSSCSSLTSVSIGNSVTSIGEYAFYSCSKLTSVTIGESVTSIGDYAFEYCTSLTKTNYTGDIAGWCNIMFGNNYANPMCYSHNFYINDQEIKDLVIPNSVTSIGNYAFYNCDSFTSINIPNSITSIGNYAFRSCSSLTSINIPNSITSIGDYAFSFCSSLTSITLPDSVTSIGEYAFYYCSSLTSINIPNSITSIGEGTFYGCSSLTSISIPNSVTSIGEYAFNGCSALTSITIPNSVTSIGERAFEYCSSLTSATIGNSVTSIGAEAFYCVNLEEIYCYPTTPPAVTSEPTFLHYNATLYVPCDSKEAYEEHPVFGKFKNIKGIDNCGGGFVTTHIHETICQGEVYEFGEYLCDTTGTYTAIIGDVTTFLYLTVLPSSIDTITVEACDSYEWHGKVYTESGVYTYRDPYNPCVIEELQLTIIDTPTPPEPEIPTEGIGVFSVGEEKTVTFSPGNLQYTQSTDTWSFAENQWEMIGTDNVTGGSVSSSLTYGDSKSGNALADMIDLFGWSTSATNFGVSTSKSTIDYSGSFVDWGTNQIGTDAPNTWRTLTGDEWYYLRYTRTNADALCGVAQVNGVNGLVFLPDNWTCPEGATFKSGFHIDDSKEAYGQYQTFTSEQWSKLEAAGAVFLSASGTRSGSTVNSLQRSGHYWSANEYNGDYARCLYFYSDEAGWGGFYRYAGRSVRLVKDVNSTTPEPPVEPEIEEIFIYQPVDSVTICATELPYIWTESGMGYTEAGTYTYAEIVEDENYIYHNIYTLDLTVIPSERVVLVEEAYDSYEWHGVVYTESGVYFYEEYCYQEILELTIIPSEDKEYVYEHHNYLVCDADIFVDPITGSTHVISSLIPFSLTWSDTIIGTNIDTIHTFNITPIVSPEPLTEEMLYPIGAVPKLVAGEKVDLMGTTELIMAYYQMVDQHDIADVIGVEWVLGHDVVLDAEQTTHTMVLEVWTQCDYIIPMEFTFPVSKKDSEPQDTTIYISYEDVTICEGITFVWMGMEFTEEGIYTYEEIVVEDDYIYHYIYTLHLMVLPPTLDMYEVTAYDSYEWHGVVYTESGVYTYEEWCYQEILELTIIPSTETAVDNMQTDSDHSAQKILRDQQILILRDDKTYTILGAEVK